MLKYRLPILLFMTVLYFFSIKDLLGISKLITFKDRHKKLAKVGLLGGSVIIYFRIVFPHIKEFGKINIVLEIFIFLHLTFFVSYFFLNKKV